MIYDDLIRQVLLAATDFTEGQVRYDVILDAKTNRSPFKYLPVLNPGGTYVTVGGLTPRLF